MTEYQIQANTKRCALTGKELRPGDRFYSVLFLEGSKFVRRDYAVEAWQGPPERTFSFWCGRIPRDEEPARPPIDDEMLLECFRRLEGDLNPSRQNFRYVLALLLLRRRRLRVQESPGADPENELTLQCVRSRETYRVTIPKLTEEEMSAVQEEVFEVLGWQ